MNKKKNNKGFTLIELLIVVAIIGILAAIAVPAFLGQQKKAKWSALQSGCGEAAKQASTLLGDLQRIDPVVLMSSPSLRACYAHRNRTQVDTGANGVPETDTCEAKFGISDPNSGYIGMQGFYGADPLRVVEELASGIAAEACGATAGNLAANGADLLAEGFDAISPFVALNKTSPYNEALCLFSVQVSPYVVAETEEGQCVLEYNEGSKSIKFIAIEDDGKVGTWGETKVWVAIAE